MPELLRLRDEKVPPRLILVRLGRTTLSDSKLADNCSDTFELWGFYGFSVNAMTRNDYRALARRVPALSYRQWIMEASGPELVADGFPLFPTRGGPHWTVVLSEPAMQQFERVRAHFSEPKLNPSWTGAGALR